MLAALPALDFFNPGGDDDGGGGAPPSVFDEVNFTMILDDSTQPPVGYTELHLDSPAEGGTNPIHQSGDTERCMLVMALPNKDDDWTMAIQLTSPTGNDTVSIGLVDGVYGTLRTQMAADFGIIFESGYFFTVQTAANKYETYVDVNKRDQVARLDYANLDVFDRHQVCLLALANA